MFSFTEWMSKMEYIQISPRSERGKSNPKLNF